MTRRRGAGMIAVLLFVAACTAGGETETSPPPTTETAPPTTVIEDGCPDVFCVTYRIRPEAKWSDGTPVSADDFVFTYNRVMAREDHPGGYDLITEVNPLDALTLRLAFSEVYPPFRTLFPVVVAAHGEGSVTSGPFILEFVGAEEVVLRRNPSYWSEADPVSGMALGDVETLRFVDPGGLRSSLAGLRRGEVDLIVPEPRDWALAELAGLDGVSLEVVPGPVWEHIDLQQEDALLSNPWVRRAFALAIDREAVADATVRSLDPSAPLLGNTVWMTKSSRYEDHYPVSYDPQAAEGILRENGCVRGEDGVFVCGEARMSFRWAAADGDPLRRAVFEEVSAQLRKVGIEVVAEFRLPSELYASDFLFGGVEAWQIINFAWQASADPRDANSIYRCGGSLNVNRYCNREVDALIDRAESTVDPDERASLYNQADALYLADLTVIPLFQRPVAVAWRSDLAGPEPNISRSTLLWNVGSWSGVEEVVIGLDAVPTLEDVLFPTSAGDAMVASALYLGAFSVGPSFDYLPVLIESVEISGGEE